MQHHPTTCGSCSLFRCWASSLFTKHTRSYNLSTIVWRLTGSYFCFTLFPYFQSVLLWLRLCSLHTENSRSRKSHSSTSKDSTTFRWWWSCGLRRAASSWRTSSASSRKPTTGSSSSYVASRIPTALANKATSFQSPQQITKAAPTLNSTQRLKSWNETQQFTEN